MEGVRDSLVGSSRIRLMDHISLGVLSEAFNRDLLDEVLVETGKRERRVRSLPAHVMMRFCLAMWLFFDDDYEEVMRKLVGSLKGMRSWSSDWRFPSPSAITQARARLGSDPLRVLFERAAIPVAGRGTKGAWLGARRLMAVDGFMIEVADTPANSEEFGRMGSGPKSSAFPQVLVVGLGECGSHAVIAAELGGARTGEQVLFPRLFRAFEPGMLVLADRNFYSFTAWCHAIETGADLLWRVNANLKLPILKWLPDGSYLSVVVDPHMRASRRKALVENARQGDDIPDDVAKIVRVIEYEIPDRTGAGTGEIVCVITTITDPDDATAAELAAAYHERWEFENGIDEKKTHLRGSGRILRSGSPDMVRQEIWAFLLTHYAIRRLMRQCRRRSRHRPRPLILHALTPHHPPPRNIHGGLSPLDA